MNVIAYDPVDQSEIAKSAASLWSSIEKNLPKIPLFSNSGQQCAFRSIVKVISDASSEVSDDVRVQYAVTFWTLTVLYANNWRFRVATNAAKREADLMKVWSVELTFVKWIGSEIPPAAVVATSMARWQDHSWF